MLIILKSVKYWNKSNILYVFYSYSMMTKSIF